MASSPRLYRRGEEAKKRIFRRKQHHEQSDTGSFGWAVLGFFIPLVGLILWMIWKNDRPGDAGMAGKGALVSVIINVVLFIL